MSNIYNNDALSLSGGTLSGGLMIGTGGTTPYLSFGDSMRMRGDSGHLSIVPLFDAKQFRIRNLANNANLFAVNINTGALWVAGSAAATTPGSVTRKLEIFDINGSSLGFIPIYGSIT